MTVEWYAACVKGAGTAPICEKQIRAYMETNVPLMTREEEQIRN